MPVLLKLLPNGETKFQFRFPIIFYFLYHVSRFIIDLLNLSFVLSNLSNYFVIVL